MKKILLIFSLMFMLTACIGGVDRVCGTYNGKTLHKGPRGGCYYINSNSNKEYVDRSFCNC